jgi:CheY-like chemotaxis protein
MRSVRVLHVDDEADIREVVEISLGLEPTFTVRSCSSGGEAIAAAAEWPPDIILLDVMMPDMDGPTTLARLRERPQSAGIPVVFMTARAQASELDRFITLGAAGVISKPFDPMTLGSVVRAYALAAETRIGMLRDTFLSRTRSDAVVLAGLRAARNRDGYPSAALDQIEAIACDVAETAGIYGFHHMSVEAGALMDAIAAKPSGAGAADIERALDDLLAGMAREPVRSSDA